MLGIAAPPDDFSLEDLEQRFITVVKVQPRLAAAHAKLFSQVLGLLNHALVDNQQNRSPETQNSLLRAINLWNILPALLHSQGDRVRRPERFTSVERGDITRLRPWRTGYTRRAPARRSGPAHR